jgi:hypothetical protein
MDQFKNYFEEKIIGMKYSDAQKYMTNLIIYEYNIEYPYKISLRDITLNQDDNFCFYRLNVTVINDYITKVHGWF